MQFTSVTTPITTHFLRGALVLQVAIDAHTRLVVALGDPQPGNRNDTMRCPGPSGQ
ncbi:hypothetical protein [Actinomadura alba]|uniref:Transposase n=1 Tax=Actinomadura alba TaxID=406431 RepID=A0ABR7LZ39_9ACTN|nr:hypothetical protein [Actinomadura alba]MBC6470116.1 hypothetical protein [Actinomadura alba]